MKDPGPPGAPGKPAFGGEATSATIDNWSLDVSAGEPWFDAGEGWEALDPRVLPGRGNATDGSRFVLWSGGPRFTGCVVKTEYLPPQDASNRDSRVSVLVSCTLPRTPAEMVAGYEVAMDQRGTLRILRLDADGKSTLLAESSGALVPVVGDRSYVITVGRTGGHLAAKVYTKDAPDPGWQVTADDATYTQGLVGVAAAGARGRISNMVATEVKVAATEDLGPGKPGKPEF